jgi:hypothetical protein
LRALPSLETAGLAHAVAQCHIPEVLNTLQHCCDNLKTLRHSVAILHIFAVCTHIISNIYKKGSNRRIEKTAK